MLLFQRIIKLFISDYDIEYYTEGDNRKADYVSEIWIPVKGRNN